MAPRAISLKFAHTPVAQPILSSPAHRYDPGADLRWLLLRPWQLISRLTVLLSQLIGLALVLLLQGSSTDAKVQKRLGQRIFTTLTNLGPCFIKLGQALSTRPDLVRRDWLDELTKLQDNLPAFPHAIALQTIEQELGAPVEQLFEEFPDHPVAAASLGQVYRAKPVGGSWVAVKVQRPRLTEQLRRDMVLIRLLGVTAAPLLPLNLGFGLLYFCFSAILDVASNVSQLSEASTPLRLLCILPVALLDALLYCWVLTGLTATLSQLTSRRQSAKLLLYRRFSYVLLASVVVSVVWVCWQMATILSDSLDQRWATLWLFDAFWHVLYFVLLLAVCSLWSPSKNNLQYAYMDEVGQEDELQAADHGDAQ